METPKKQDASLQALLESEQFKKAKQIFDKTKEWVLYVWHIFLDFLNDKKYDRQSLMFIAFFLFVIAGYFGYTTYQKVIDLNTKVSVLDQTSTYSDIVSSLQGNRLTVNIATTSDTVYDLIQGNQDISDEIQRYQVYKESLYLPYTYFLDYIFLPRLNVWKEYYTDELKINSFWEEFLKVNSYIDINLVQKWTDFFSITQQNEINKISNIKIWEVTEYDDWIFGIDVSFQFITPSKNALWFLLDKLTLTSDQSNITLLGEFFYYLREQIKQEENAFLTDQLGEEWPLWPEATIDKLLWYHLYNWVFEDWENNLIDNVTVNRAIFSMMRCTPENENQCFFRFREKYRNIASLAYTMGMKDNNNKVEDLKKFLKNIPPLMTLKKFDYNKTQDVSLIKQNTVKYNGSVELELFGKVVTDEDRDEIARALWMQCFREEEKMLSIDEAMMVIDETINQKSDNIEENQAQTEGIWDIKRIIEDVSLQYESLSNYKKTIKIFEIYRMLNENWLCKVLDSTEDGSTLDFSQQNSSDI
jgi:hypothetical protein